MVDKIKDQVASFIGVAIGLLAFGFLASGSNKIAIFIVSAMFGLGAFMLVLSLKYKPRWLKKTTQQLSTIPTSHLTIFLALIGLTLIVWQKQFIVFGIVVLYVAYILVGAVIGVNFGNALVSLYYRFRYKKWSVKQAAILMGISQGRVRNLLVEGRIKGEKENNKWTVLKLGYERRNLGRSKNTILEDQND